MAKRAELKVVTPGEEPSASPETEPTPDAAESLANTSSQEGVVSAAAAPMSARVPDQSEVDPSQIPYGKTLLTKQGYVCSTAPDPKRT